jgi:hypothetical protein
MGFGRQGANTAPAAVAAEKANEICAREASKSTI